MAAVIGYESTATCIFVYCAYRLQQCYKIIPSNPREDKTLRYYCGYIIGTITISMFIILIYDLGTRANKGKFNGHCGQQDPILNTSVTIMFAETFTFSNGVIQIAMFILYLYYWYKLRYLTDYQTNKMLFHIAVILGTTIGITIYFFHVNRIIASANDTSLSNLVGSVMLFLQHCVIVDSLKWVIKIYKVICKREVETTSSE